MMEVFKGNTNQNGKYGGAEFPRFEVGKNEISWTGNVSKIKLQPVGDGCSCRKMKFMVWYK